jgi:hypothetical protein
MIVLCTHQIYVPYYLKICHEYDRDLSMMKFMKYLTRNPEKIIELISALKNSFVELDTVSLRLIKYCAYDKRQRLSLKHLENELLLS